MISLLTPMPELRMRKNLFNIFQLSCLCLTYDAPDLPSVNLQGIDTSDPRS